MKKIQVCLGENIKKLRQEKGFTQAQCATEAGISLSFLQNIEKGKRWVGPDTITLLARFFAVTESELFHDCERLPQPDPKMIVTLIAKSLGVEIGMIHR